MAVTKGDSETDRQLSEQLRRYLLARGADLVGFGPVGRLDGTPEILQPHRYLPDARSLIAVALRINDAACDLIARSVHERSNPPSYHSYQLFTLTIINPQLDQIACHGAKFLEQRGYRAYPFPANFPHVLKPTAEYPGGPGDISHKHVAVACGLGQIGWHTMLVTPQFGTRQKLTSIVTNALLEPDPRFWRAALPAASMRVPVCSGLPDRSHPGRRAAQGQPTDRRRDGRIRPTGRLAMPLGLQRYAQMHRWLQRHPDAGNGTVRGGAAPVQSPSGPMAAAAAQPRWPHPLLRPMPLHLPPPAC